MADSIFRPITPELLLQALIFIFIGIILLRIIRSVLVYIAERVSSNRRLSILYFVPILRLFIIIGVIFATVRLFIDTSQQNLFAILGGLGIVLGFAFKDYLSNLVAGMVILYEGPFRPGDWIEVNGIYGEVKSIGLRMLEIHTPDDNIVKIPQSVFWTSPLSNSSSGKKDVMCVIHFYIDPTEASGNVIKLLKDATYSSSYYQYQKGINVIVSEKPGFTHYKVKAYPIDARTQFKFMTDITIRAKELLILKNIKYYKFDLHNN